MQSTQVKYILSSDPCFLSNPIKKTTNLPSRNLAFSTNGPVTLAARWKKKRPSSFGSIRSTRIMLQSAYFLASKFKILPEPLDTIIREFSSGSGNGNGGGGGFNFWKGNGWGGFNRRKKINLGFWGVIFVILGVGGGILWLVLGKELEVDVFWGFLGLTLFGFSVNVWKRGVLDWVLGFCCCAALVGAVVLKQDLQRFFGTIKVARRRRKRRLF